MSLYFYWTHILHEKIAPTIAQIFHKLSIFQVVESQRFVRLARVSLIYFINILLN